MSTSNRSFLELARERRSTRAFKSDPVPHELIAQVTEAAYNAPAGSGHRGLWIVVVEDEAQRRLLRERCEPWDMKWVESRPEPLRTRIKELPGFQREKVFLTEAPVLLVVCNEPRNSNYPYPIESAWTAIENICLAATDLGLGTLTYTPEISRLQGQQSLHDILGLPREKRVQAVMPLGYPDTERLGEREREPDFKSKVFLGNFGTFFPFPRSSD
ncbi:MAG: nitroreductase family protein [Acidobacteriota bacterium]